MGAKPDISNNPRPLGYVKPNAIKAILRGESVDTQVGYKAKTDENVIHSIGEVWVDSESRKWIQRDGFKERVTKYDEIRHQLNPYTCPQCGKVLRSNADTKFMKIRNKCLDCIVNEDSKRIIDGTMEKYERQTMLNNAKAYFLDVKVQMTEYISSLQPNQEYINEDGSIEKWTADISTYKEFFTNELKDVNEMLEKIDKELEEVSKL